MTHLKLQIGDATGHSDGSLQWVTIDLSAERYKTLTDEQVMEWYVVPAARQLVREARYLLSKSVTRSTGSVHLTSDSSNLG